MTPGAATSGGAVTVLQVCGEPSAIDAIAARMGIGSPVVGRVLVRDFFGIDRGVACLLTPTVLQIMPHAGKAVERAILDGLAGIGVTLVEPTAVTPRALYPEAADNAEACALDVLARAVSPLAVDAVLRSLESWRSERGAEAIDARRQHALDRLLCAPTVAVIGFANVGKSTLLNALAGDTLAVVSDQPGTTLDHIGASLCLDGLMVQWIDTPGWRADAAPEELEARAAAVRVVGRADLVVLCADAAAGAIEPSVMGTSVGTPVIRVGTRAALCIPSGCDLVTDALSGSGIPELARLVRQTLVPDEALERPGRWVYHAGLLG